MTSSMLSNLSDNDLKELADLEKLLPSNSVAQIKMLKHVIIGLKKKLKQENEAHMAARNELCNYLADYTTATSSASTTLDHDRRIMAEVGSTEEKLITVKAELASLTSKYSDLYRSLTALREQYEVLLKSDAEKAQKVSSLQSQLEKSEQSATSMREEAERAAEMYTKMEQDKTNLQTENMRLKSELTSNSHISNKNIADLELQLAKVANELTLVKEARSRLEMENERLCDKIRNIGDEKSMMANADYRRELDAKTSEIARLSVELEVIKRECSNLHTQNNILQTESKSQLSLLNERSSYELSHLRTEYEEKLASERKQASSELSLQAERHSLALAAEAARHDKELNELKQELKKRQTEVETLAKQVGDGRRALMDLRAKRQADNDQFLSRMKNCKILLEEYQARLVASGEAVDPIDYEQLSFHIHDPTPIPTYFPVDPSPIEQPPPAQAKGPEPAPKLSTTQPPAPKPLASERHVIHENPSLHNAVEFVDTEPSLNETETMRLSVKSSVIDQIPAEELINLGMDSDAEEIAYEITISDIYLKRDLLPSDLLNSIRHVFAVVYFWDFQPLVSRAVDVNNAQRQLQLGLKLTAQNLVAGNGPLFRLYLETRTATVEVYGISTGPGQLIGVAKVPLRTLLTEKELRTEASVTQDDNDLGRVTLRIMAEREAL